MTPAIRKTVSLLFCWLTLAPHLVAQEKHPLADVGRVNYEFWLGNRTVGDEQVTFRGDGWSVEGRFQRGGNRRVYTASWTHSAARTAEWRVSGTRGDIRCDWHDDSIAVFAGENKQNSAHVDWSGDSVPLFYENLVWTVYSELGVRLFAKNDAPPRETVTLYDPRAGRTIAVTVRSVKTRQWERDGTEPPVELRDAVILLGELEIHTTFTASGLLLHLSVPSQQIQVICRGYQGAAREGEKLLDFGPWRALLSEPNHEFTRREGLRATMRDGVVLVADAFVPQGAGPWPTVLVRTPYGRAKPSRSQGSFWARRGYAFVAQDVRGCFDSEGEWSPALHETADGSDTIDWIAAQDWSDGSVGMIGGSYAGWAQLLAAVSGNPHLKAIVPQVAPPDPLEAFPYEGGAFQLGVAWWAMVVDRMAKGENGPPPAFSWPDVMRTLPLTDLDSVMGIDQPVLDEWLSHPPSDAEYWNRLSYQHRLEDTDVPALHITGWYDGDLPGSLENYPILRRHAKSARSRRGQFLIVGPWGHAFNQSRRIGKVDFGPESLVDLNSVYIRFFDRYLKGIENAIENEDPVLTFVMGRNSWRTDTSWPLTGTQFTKLFLGSDGAANNRDGTGRLALVQSSTASADTFVYDPADPAPTPEVSFGDPLKHSRLIDLSQTADRDDVLDYTTEPLAASVEIVGPVELVVWIETDATDTDVCAKLLRIEPNGTARRITGGIQRLRYRKGPGTDAPVEPGAPARVTVRLRATGIALAPGDRLRLEVSSSDFPNFDRHPNRLVPATGTEELRVATTRVLHDLEHPSHLLIPVVPNKDNVRELRFKDD